MKLLSVIIPIHNEEENIKELHTRLVTTIKSIKLDYEIIFVDDGSTDNSLAQLKALHKEDKKVKIISFSRNFGHHIALTAGIDTAQGDFTVIMDGDLQDRPEEIPTIYKKLQEGYNAVISIRKERQDSAFKKWGSNMFFFLTNKIANINMPPNQSMLRIIDKSVLAELKKFREIHFMLAGIMSWVGFKQTTCLVQHDARKHGHSKYNLRKSIMMTLDAIISFSHKPLLYISSLGIFMAFLAILYSLYIIYQKIVHNIGLAGWPSLISVTTFLGGLILFSLGLVGLYVGRVYEQSLNRPLYIIKEKIQ